MQHPMDGSRAKLERAKETLDALELEVVNYFAQTPPPVRLEKKHINRGLEYAFIAYGDPSPPLRISVITGEIVHHLRSSLDHLIHALVIHNGVSPTFQHQFPICSTEKAFKHADQRGQIKGIGANARRLIRSVQPFTTPTPEDTILYVVSQYDNADKHRLLVVVTSVADLGKTVTIGTKRVNSEIEEHKEKVPNIVGFGEMGAKKVSSDGTIVWSIKFAEPAPEFTADALLVPQLAFDQCGRVKFAPLIPTLRNILAGTRHTIEVFAGEFNAHTGKAPEGRFNSEVHNSTAVGKNARANN